MSAQIIDGYQLAKHERKQMKQEVSHLKKEKGVVPGLAIVLVKSPFDRASIANLKQKICKQVGVNCTIHELPQTSTEEQIAALISSLNVDPNVHGINLHPLPPHLQEGVIDRTILPEKDVEGLNPYNLGNFVIGKKKIVPFTPLGIMKLIDSTGVDLKGKHAVVVGRGNIVGKPVAFMLLERHATVTICHSRTVDLGAETRKADVLVVAAGIPHLVKGDMIKPGAIVIDVAVNRLGGRLAGDVDYKTAVKTAGWITPIPLGVGPMTITMLINNVIDAAQ